MSHTDVRLLVTGFGRFPGAPRNPTATLMHRLTRHHARLERFGIDVTCAILPVVYADLPEQLDSLLNHSHPDGVLHFGLAPRRTVFSVETRALNRRSPLRFDAGGARPARAFIAAGGAFSLHSRFPAQAITTTLEQAHIPSGLSRDAGDYLCNMALYLSCRSGVASTGFIHVPARVRPRPDAMPQPLTLAMLERAALITIFVMAHDLRVKRRLNRAKAQSCDKGAP